MKNPNKTNLKHLSQTPRPTPSQITHKNKNSLRTSLRAMLRSHQRYSSPPLLLRLALPLQLLLPPLLMAVALRIYRQPVQLITLGSYWSLALFRVWQSHTPVLGKLYSLSLTFANRLWYYKDSLMSTFLVWLKNINLRKESEKTYGKRHNYNGWSAGTSRR